MQQVKKGDTVKVHYTAKVEDGKVFDSSTNREPLQFTVGEGKVISGFEQAVVGMIPGESKTEKIPADKAFGPHRKELVVEVDREKIPTDVQLEVGKSYQIPQPDGKTTEVIATDVTESKVILDANHPLAGKNLLLHIQLLEIA